MTELSLYTFLENTASVITPIQGRFAVLEGYGNDLNADNNDDVIVGNLINQQPWSKKYPCAALMPPVEISRNKKNSTTRFQLTMFFLTTSYSSGSGSIKKPNIQTNTSKVSIKEDWSEMRTAAENFIATLQSQFYSDITILQYIRPVKTSQETYDRVSNMGNDKATGVKVIFELDVVNGCVGVGSVPDFTPPTACRVCDPTAGTPLQVWTISEDGTTVGFADPTGDGGSGGGAAIVKVPVTGNYTALAVANTHYVLFVTAAANITLPTAIGNTCVYEIKKNTAATVNIIFTAGQNADGSTTIPMIKQYEAKRLISDNANYGIF